MDNSADKRALCEHGNLKQSDFNPQKQVEYGHMSWCCGLGKEIGRSLCLDGSLGSGQEKIQLGFLAIS